MRSIQTLLVTTLLLSGAAYAGSEQESDYQPPQSLDSIGSMFLEADDEVEAKSVGFETEVSGCKSGRSQHVIHENTRATLQAVSKAQLKSLAKLKQVATAKNYTKALAILEEKLLEGSASQVAMKKALHQYREKAAALRAKDSGISAEVLADVDAALAGAEAALAGAK